MTGFRCPHCKQPTIGAWGKLKSNGWKPRPCAHCGGRYVPLVWVSLLPIVVFGGVLLLGGLHAVEELAAGAVLSLVAAACLYLFTPLLPYPSPAARRDLWTFVAALAAVAVYATLQPAEPPAEERAVVLRGPTTWYISDAEEREQYKARLRSLNIPFTVETRDGKEIILVEQPK